MCKHFSGTSSVLAHHCSKITKLEWRRRLNPCCRAQLDQSKHVSLNVLLESCLQNDSGLPDLEFMAAGCKPLVVRRASPAYFGGAVGVQSMPVEGGGSGGGGGARTCAELAGVENNVIGAVVST